LIFDKRLGVQALKKQFTLELKNGSSFTQPCAIKWSEFSKTSTVL